MTKLRWDRAPLPEPGSRDDQSDGILPDDVVIEPKSVRAKRYRQEAKMRAERSEKIRQEQVRRKRITLSGDFSRE